MSEALLIWFLSAQHVLQTFQLRGIGSISIRKVDISEVKDPRQQVPDLLLLLFVCARV